MHCLIIGVFVRNFLCQRNYLIGQLTGPQSKGFQGFLLLQGQILSPHLLAGHFQGEFPHLVQKGLGALQAQIIDGQGLQCRPCCPRLGKHPCRPGHGLIFSRSIQPLLQIGFQIGQCIGQLRHAQPPSRCRLVFRILLRTGSHPIQTQHRPRQRKHQHKGQKGENDQCPFFDFHIHYITTFLSQKGSCPSFFSHFPQIGEKICGKSHSQPTFALAFFEILWYYI